MKVLFTGMLSAHCKVPTDVSNKTFYTAFSLVFRDLYPEAEIEWKAPSLAWDEEYLSQYDFIFIGMVPPTSMSANMIYGTLKCLDTVYDWTNVRLIMDSPQLWQYAPGLSAISKDPTYLVSSFYSKRPGYKQADTYKTLSSFKRVAERLLTEKWPKVVYPELPWHDSARKSELISDHLPHVTDAFGLNLDGYFLNNKNPDYREISDAPWSVDSFKSKWAGKLSRTVAMEFNELKLGKSFNDVHAEALLRTSIGLIVPPADRNVGTWWSYRYVQGLLSGVPVATEWTESKALGPSWAVLPYQIEDMTPAERKELAQRQLEAYKDNALSFSELKQKIALVLNYKGEQNA
jgi:hypothetical protein